MKVLVCGGRDYNDSHRAFLLLNVIHRRTPISLVIEGGARGADRLGREWALLRALPVMTFNAKWREHGKAAGAIRNADMLTYGKPDLVVAFPGGIGTADMVRRAEKAGVPVVQADCFV